MPGPDDVLSVAPAPGAADPDSVVSVAPAVQDAAASSSLGAGTAGATSSPDTPVSVNGVAVGPDAGKGFWSDFGKGTQGVVGLLKAPFVDSIPANLVKAAAKDPWTYYTTGVPGLVYKKVEDFLHQDERKPLSQRMKDSFRELVQTAKTRPGLALGSVVHGVAADPELLVLPGLGEVGAAAKGAELATAAGAGARTAEVVGVISGKAGAAGGGAAIGGGAELASELGNDRELDPGALGTSALLGSVAGATMQVKIKGEAPTPKLTPQEIDDVLGPVMRDSKTGAAPKAKVEPTADGYVMRIEGEADGKTFATKAEAEAAQRELEQMGAGYQAMGTVPRGTSERSKLFFEDPFTPENMAKWTERPKEGVKETGTALLKYWGTAAAGAGIGAGIGAYLNKDDPAAGATFGAGITLVPRALEKIGPASSLLSIAEVVNRRNGELAVMARHTLQFKAAIDAAVPEALRRTAISMALEKTEGIKLNPVEQRVAQSVREFFDGMGEAAVKAGVLKELLHDYISHIVEEDPDAKQRDTIGKLVDVLAGKTRGTQPSGRQFAQHRRYATFDELQQALRGSGLRIKTGDVGEIMATYSKSMYKAITDKRVIEALKRTPVEGMRPLVVPREVPVPPRGKPGTALETTIEGEVTGSRGEPPALPGPGSKAVGPTADAAIAHSAEGVGFHLPDAPGPGEAARRFAARGERMLLQPVDKIDSNYTVLPSRQLAGYAVHKDIAPQLNFIFSARDPNDVTLGLMALNQASKRAVVSFSLFHAKSLTDAFIGAMGTKALTGGGPYKQAVRAVEMFKRGGSNEGIDHLLRGGLVLQETPEDVAHGALGHVANIIDKALPVSASGKAAKAVSAFNTALDNFTFSTLQTGFKIVTGLDAYERLVKKGIAPEVAGKLAASYANDIYGSLDWFRVANDVGSRLGRDAAYMFFNPNGRRVGQLLMFAPDWTFSTFRAAYKAIPGAVDDPALAALHRRYLAKSAIYYLTIANGINLLTSGHSIFENENPTRIQLKDGRTMQWSKHSMEPFEWLRDPMQTSANKLAFLPREAVQQLTGKEYISVHDSAPDIDNRAMHLADQFLPIMAQQGLAGGGATSAMGLVGMPVYGKDEGQKREARLAAKKAAADKRKRAAAYYQRLNN
jgi:hypothetical protein